MFSRVVATGQNRVELTYPYAGCADHTLLRQDGPPNATDSYNAGVDTTGHPFGSTLKSKVWARGALLYLTRQLRAVVVGTNTGANLQLTIEVDFGTLTRTDIGILSPPPGTTLATPARVRVNFNAIDVADAAAVSVQLSDLNTGIAPIIPWALDQWTAADDLEGGTR